MKELLKGAILIYSCHKHKETRLQEFKLPKNEYHGWKVFYILGDPRIDASFIIDNTILLKCEDSYIHVAKKVVMGIKFIYDNYEIEEGILRCGDDLIFNDSNLETVLKMKKTDYMGSTNTTKSGICTEQNYFMPSYYLSHREDFQNPLHQIPYNVDEIRQFNKIPVLTYAGGVVVYLSNKSCEILIEHFEKIKWNVFHLDDTYGYPYIIEDIAVGYILYINNIFLCKTPLYVDQLNEATNMTVALHTNKYK